MIISKRYSFLLAICLALISTQVVSQSFLNLGQDAGVKQDSLQTKPEAIPLNSINSASTGSFLLFSMLGSEVLTEEDKNDFIANVDSIISRTNFYFNDTIGIDFKNLNFRDIDILSSSLDILQNDLNDLQNRIDLNLQQIQYGKDELDQNRERWMLTKEKNDADNTPEAISRRINNVINRNDSVRSLLDSDINFLLTQSDKVTGIQIKLNQFNNDLEAYNKLSTSKVFKRDMPPIWKLFSSDKGIGTKNQWKIFREHIRNDTEMIFREFSDELLIVLIIFIILTVMVFWLKMNVKDSNIKGKKVVLSLFVNEIFQKPFEVSLLLGLYLIWLIIPELPISYGSVLAIISVYAILRIAYEILQEEYKRFLFGFAIAYIALRLSSLFYEQQFISRSMLLVSQIVAILFLIKFIEIRRTNFSNKKKSFSYFLTILSVLYLFLIFVALIGNIAGTISFSEYLSGGIIKSGFMILTTYIGFHITNGLVFLLLSSSIFKHSNIIKKQGAFILDKIYKALRFFFTVAWFFIALEQFKVRTAVVNWGAGILKSELTIGKAPITPVNIILFIFVIWLSIFISKIVRSILNDEVFPRVKVERGMPGTIVMLVRICLVTIGFFLAAKAAGVDFNSLTIIIGAFSVGIGFGLQNIFNNLVSGLILAFERPIKEGDIVELNTLLGIVKKIGIRSSIVRTTSGAEVIVPNGELISKELINWTLSDQYRRADIRVGVAYGTDPNIVVDLLHKVATNNERVNKDPQPLAFFIDFGESSLDFRLLAWIDQEYRLEVESELRVAIFHKLAEAGIEIPFPQRDLHLRSVDGEAGKKLKGR